MLYGRQGEQERVCALLDAAQDRRSGALLVVGEPGAGKSALPDEARADASDMAALEAPGGPIGVEAAVRVALPAPPARARRARADPASAGGGAGERARAAR